MTDATLVVDIGGTNTRVAWATGPDVDRGTIRRYRNADHTGLTPILGDFLAQDRIRPSALCVAAAGPVSEGVLRLTNLDWTVSLDELRRDAGADQVFILNDLQAQGYGIANVTPDVCKTLIEGAPTSPHATKLVVNVGTGMNVAPIYYPNGRAFVPPAEAGHIALAPQSEAERQFQQFLQTRHGYASVEEALSGRGLEAMYEMYAGQSVAAADIMARLSDDTHAQAALTLFTSILGQSVADLALIHLPLGGVYLVGGVVRHLTPFLSDFGFREAFNNKGRFSSFMGQFAVRTVEDDYTAICGCAAYVAATRA